MLTNGFNHVAILTSDSEPGCTPSTVDVFDAPVRRTVPTTGRVPPRASASRSSTSGRFSELNVFEIDGNTEAERQTPMFGRGRIDHLALQAASLDGVRDDPRPAHRHAAPTDGFVTDFGPILSLFFRDPDGLECEVCVENPDAEPGVFHPPGTPAARYPPRSDSPGSSRRSRGDETRRYTGRDRRRGLGPLRRAPLGSPLPALGRDVPARRRRAPGATGWERPGAARSLGGDPDRRRDHRGAAVGALAGVDVAAPARPDVRAHRHEQRVRGHGRLPVRPVLLHHVRVDRADPAALDVRRRAPLAAAAYLIPLAVAWRVGTMLTVSSAWYVLPACVLLGEAIAWVSDELRRSQASDREHARSVRKLFSENPQPMWVFDVESLRFLEVNDAAIDHYGYTREEFLAMRITDIRPPEEVPGLLAEISTAAGLVHSGARRHRTKDGRLIDVQATSHQIDFDGVNAALVAIQDVTDRNRLESQLRYQRVPRLAHPARQPVALRRPGRARDRAPGPGRELDRGRRAGPRRLQDHQRQPRAHGGRPAAGRGRATAAEPAAPR